MKLSRRQFIGAVATAALLPAAGGTSPAWAVNRKNMWAPDLTSEGTLFRCNRILAANENDILALCHRGQVSPFGRAEALAEADLKRAINLQIANPALHYISGVMLNRSADLKQAISLLSAGGDSGGRAVCSSTPDIYHWKTGIDDGELFYMSHSELGYVLEQEGRYDEALAAFEVVASLQVISQADLERWTESSPQVARFCEAVVGYKHLIEIEPRPAYFKRLEDCERWMRVPRSEWWRLRAEKG